MVLRNTSARPRRRALLLATGAVAALLGPALARAEEAPAPGEVVVTGQRQGDTDASSALKSPLPIAETPQSVSVIDGAELDLRVVQNLNQALRYTAGVGPETRGNTAGRYDQLTLRGFSPDQYLDGLRLIGSQGGYGIPQIDVSRLDRIEIVKGPASVLYGQGSPGGIVALQSKLPTPERFGEAALTGGSFGYGRGEVDLGGPIDAEGKWLFRVSGEAQRTDTEISHTEAERWSISPALTWRPDAETSWTLLYTHQEDPEGGDYGAMPSIGSLIPNPNGRVARDFFGSDPGFEQFRRQQDAVTSLFTRKLGFGDWTFSQSTRYARLTSRYRSLYFYPQDPDLTTITRYVARADESADDLTTDTRVAGSFDTGALHHSMVLGVDWLHSGQREAAGFGGSGGVLNIFDPVYTPAPSIIDPGVQHHYRLNLQQTGAYVQDQISWGGWRLLLSGRHDWFTSDQYDRLTRATSDLSGDKFTGRAGLLYAFDNGLAPYASYATSFLPQTATDKNGNVLAPTGGKQVEVGVKYQPKVWDALFTLAVYDLKQTNVAEQDPTAPAGAFYSVAAGEVRSRGVELEGSVHPRQGLELRASYTYLDNKVTRDTGGMQGARPYGVPQQTASGFGYYTLQGGPLAGVGAGVGVRYLGQSFDGVLQSAGGYKIPDATLVDLLAGYDFSRLSPRLNGIKLDLVVNNLADTRYVTSCYSTVWCWYGPGRSVQATVRYRW